jgi:hypothetical protein
VQIAAAEPPSPKVVSFDPPAAPAPAATTVTIAAPSATSVVIVDNPPADQAVVVHNPFAAPEAQGPAAKESPAKAASQPAQAAAPASRPPEFAVQIAAVASAKLARDSWQALKAKLPDLVQPTTFAVERVSDNGRTLYRALLLGFSSSEEAAALCKKLRSQSVDCILRQMR